MPSIFDPTELTAFSCALLLTEEEVLRGFDCLKRLQHLHRSGYLATLKETQAEQSFNERVFAEAFGYQTLFAPSQADSFHNLLPQVYVGAKGNGAFPDFVLGEFTRAGRSIAVTAELKGPNADLDEPQKSKGYKDMTPVEQAAAAAMTAEADWFIVSNLTETRLYRTDLGLDCFEAVNLANIESVTDFKRAYSLFSKRALLGTGRTSPLSRLYRSCIAGETMIIPKREQSVRLIQRSRLVVPETTLSKEHTYSRMDTALSDAAKAAPHMAPANDERRKPQLREGFLTIDRVIEDHVWKRAAADKSGALVCSLVLPISPAGSPVHIDTNETLHWIQDTLIFAEWYYASLIGDCEFISDWALVDLDGTTVLNNVTERSPATFTCKDGVAETTHPEERMDARKKRGAVSLQEIAVNIACELFYPFEAHDDFDRRIRFSPTKEQIAKAFSQS